MLFAFKASSFIYAIIGIVLTSPEKEMVRSDAWRVITFMKNHKIVRDFPKSQDIGKTVCQILLIGGASGKPTIPITEPTSLPLPAFVRFFDLNPESLTDCQLRGFAVRAILSIIFSMCLIFANNAYGIVTILSCLVAMKFIERLHGITNGADFFLQDHLLKCPGWERHARPGNRASGATLGA